MLKIAFILLISFNSWAGIKNLLPLERLLDPEALSKGQNEVACREDNLTPNLHSDCLIDICGTPSEIKSVTDHLLGIELLNGQEVPPITLQARPTDPVKERIIAKINEFYDLRAISPVNDIEESDIDEVVSKLSSKLKADGIGDDLGVLVNGALLIATERRFENYFILNVDIDIDNLSIKFTDEFLKSFDDKPRMKAYLSEYESWMNKKGLIAQRTYDPEIFIKSTYPNLSLEEGIKLYFKKLETLQSELEAFSPFFDVASLNINSFQQKLELGHLTDIDLKLALAEGYKIENRKQLSKLLKDSYSDIVQEVKTDLESGLSKLISENGLNTLNDRVKKGLNEVRNFYNTDKENKVHDALFECTTAYDYTRIYLPSEKQINNYMQLTDSAKQDFMVALKSFSGISDSSKPALNNQIQKVRFAKPLSREAWLSTIEESLDQYIDNEKSSKTRIDKARIIEGIALKSLAEDETEEGIKNFSNVIYDPISSLCQNLNQDPFSDATLVATGIIIPSFSSVLMDEASATSIIYHEISHNLERFLNSGVSEETNSKFKNSKQCISSMHEYLGEGGKSFGKYFKEDFADYMSALLLPKNSKNGICHSFSYNRYIEEYNVDSFINDNEHDDHSNSLFRVMRHKIDNGGDVPNSCVDAMASEGIFAVSETCKF